MTSVSHGGDCEDSCLLGCSALHGATTQKTAIFRRRTACLIRWLNLLLQHSACYQTVPISVLYSTSF
jgi:hypothetical protein